MDYLNQQDYYASMIKKNRERGRGLRILHTILKLKWNTSYYFKLLLTIKCITWINDYHTSALYKIVGID